MDFTEEKERIISFISSKLLEEDKDGFVIGLSGGIDSTVVAYLLKEAVGIDKIFALIMPELDSDPSSRKDALMVAKNLRIRCKVLPITEILWATGVYRDVPLWMIPSRILKEKKIKGIYKHYENVLGKPLFFSIKDRVDPKLYWFNRGKAYYSIKHRVRMTLLYFFAEKMNYLTAGCINLTEKLIGFYVRYGDDASDIAPISHLYKTEVMEFARFLNLPEKIIEKEPTPDLIPGITDEFSIGISYGDLDRILKAFEEGKTPEEIEGVDKDMLNLIYDQYMWIKKQEKKPLHLERRVEDNG